MSELLLSLFRIGFLVALWWFVFSVVSVLRRDLQAPRDAKPMTPARRGRRRCVWSSARGWRLCAPI